MPRAHAFEIMWMPAALLLEPLIVDTCREQLLGAVGPKFWPSKEEHDDLRILRKRALQLK